ncbi:MAG: PIN domain-containing protein [Chloroflexi bacterium]|nr:PIN domain-containing protein [Chloroflexota bacterium]
MPSQRERIYWDADVFLSYINGIEDRLAVLDALLADSASDKGTIELYTSIVSQVEVAFAKTEQEKKALDADVEKQIDAMWADRSALKLVEFHDAISRQARELIRMAITRGWSLKPHDAIHLATAKQMQVAEFHTYDKALDKYSSQIGFSIQRPHTGKPRLMP